MNNSPQTIDPVLLAALQRRWPHDHWFFLWLASVVGWLSCFLHIPMPWGEGGASILARFALFMAPGAIFLSLLAPKPSTAEGYIFSRAYQIWRILRWVLVSGSLLGWIAAWMVESPWGMAWSLCLFCLVWWVAELQYRIIRLPGETWHVGFPIQAERDAMQEEDTSVDRLGKPLERGRWRILLFFGLWLGWTLILWWSNHGTSSKLPGVWSVATLVLWCLGGLWCLALSRWPPTWWEPRGVVVIWRDLPVVRRIFLWSTLPWCVLTLLFSGYHIICQLWWTSPLDFSFTTLLYDMCLGLAALVLLSDPSGVFAWIGQPTSSQIWVRRHGWIETFPVDPG